MDEETKKEPLLPDALKKPHYVIWAMIVPQAVLLLLNIRAYALVSGEMSAAQKQSATQIFVFELLLLAIGIGVWLYLRTKKMLIEWHVCIPMIIFHIGYLWFATAVLDTILPDTVTLWIFTPGQYLYYQFALMMPMLFYSTMMMACADLNSYSRSAIGVSLVALVGIPAAWYVVMHVMIRWVDFPDLPTFMLIVLLVLSTVIILMAFLRVSFRLYMWLSKIGNGEIVLAVLAGIAAPVGGLLLNASIPFPYDFQDLWVYAFAVANGLILLIPTRKEEPSVSVWAARCVFYAFTLYFFIVFLPYLPLSLLAMIAMGAGALILAPTFLFAIHTRKILDEGAALIEKMGHLKTAALFAICILVLPGLLTIRAIYDKAELTAAISAVFDPDYTAEETGINPAAARRSLLRLRDMKEGIFLPFVSDYYNSVVFNGMVLPDHKMEQMWKTLFGEEIPEPNRGGGLGFLGRRSRGMSTFNQRPVRMPERNVELTDVITETERDEDITNTSVTLSMTNNGGPQSEFVADIHIPDGVLLTDYWLRIDETDVPGRIFERKTAMWIYHMIRDTERRDPGLLVYKTDNIVRLSVFPFEAEQTRVTGLRFTFHSGTRPTIRIGERYVDLASEAQAIEGGILKVVHEDGEQSIVVPAGLPSSIVRKPYFHFIVDRSVNAEEVFGRMLTRMEEVIQTNPDIGFHRITVANYDYRHVTSGIVPCTVESARGALRESDLLLPFRGGFWADRAIKGAMLDMADTNPVMPDGSAAVPVFVVVASHDMTMPKPEGLAVIADLVPDYDGYYLTQAAEKGLDYVSFSGETEKTVSAIKTPRPIIMLSCGEEVRACDAVDGGVITFPSAGELSAQKARVIDSSSKYAQGIDLWHKYRKTVYEPRITNATLPEIVRQSRETGVMVPSTSYIVVENTAQWEMLRRKEQQSLSANNVLEFDEFQESPAPPVIFLLPVIALLLRRRKKRRGSKHTIKE